MKNVAYSTMAVFTSLTMLGILFKVMHWPGAGIGLIVGVGGLSLFAVPLFTIYKLRST